MCIKRWLKTDVCSEIATTTEETTTTTTEESSTTATTVQLATLAATSGAKWRVRIKNVTEMNCWMIDSIKI